MTTTFDGSSEYEAPSGPMLGSRVTDEPDFDAFEALRGQLEERDESDEEFADVSRVEVPGIGWRLVCSLDFDYRQYQQWQKAALPKNQRNGRKLNPLDMDQAQLSYLVLVNTCVGVEYRRGGDWARLTEPDGSPATLQTSTMLNRMDMVDPRLLVRRLFKGDGRLIAAGQKVIADAGYGDGGDSGGDEDPTD